MGLPVLREAGSPSFRGRELDFRPTPPGHVPAWSFSLLRGLSGAFHVSFFLVILVFKLISTFINWRGVAGSGLAFSLPVSRATFPDLLTLQDRTWSIEIIYSSMFKCLSPQVPEVPRAALGWRRERLWALLPQSGHLPFDLFHTFFLFE